MEDMMAALACANARLNRCATEMRSSTSIKIKTPCVTRPTSWFTQHKQELRLLARTEFIKSMRIHLSDEHARIADLPDEAMDVLFDRVTRIYCNVASTGKLEVVITYGCTSGPRWCAIVWYQRALLAAIRQKVKQETELMTRFVLFICLLRSLFHDKYNVSC